MTVGMRHAEPFLTSDECAFVTISVSDFEFNNREPMRHHGPTGTSRRKKETMRQGLWEQL